MKLSVTCLEWKALERGTLLGFAAIKVDQMRLVVRDIAVHEKSGKRWAQLPAKPQISKDRELIKNRDGKVQYATILEFETKQIADAFSDAVIRALDDFGASANGRAAG